MNIATFWKLFVRKQVAGLKAYNPKQQVGFYFFPPGWSLASLKIKDLKLKQINLELYL